MNRTPSRETRDWELEDDEHATYLERPTMRGWERLREMARNSRHLGRRSLVTLRLCTLRLRLQALARRRNSPQI